MDLAIPDFNALLRVGRAFALNYADKDNTLPADYSLPVDPDVTFLRVDMAGLDATVHSGEGTNVNLTLPHGLRLSLDDLAEDNWLSHIQVDVPDLHLAGQIIQDPDSAIWSEVVSADAGLVLQLGKTASDYTARQRQQVGFLIEQDSLTRRCPELYSGTSTKLLTNNQQNTPALFLPPLTRRGNDKARGFRSRTRKRSASALPKHIRAQKLSTASRDTGHSSASRMSITYDSLLQKSHYLRNDRNAGCADGPTFVRLDVDLTNQLRPSVSY